MSNTIDFTGLPAYSQIAFLPDLAPLLWQRPDVVGLWLEGSLARGNADRYSDVDLYIGVTPATLDDWRSLAVESLFGDQYAAHFFSNFAKDFFVYHVYLQAGGIYDLHIQPRDRELPKANRLILACRDDDYRTALLAATPDPATDPALPYALQPVDPTILPGLLTTFWMNVDKSRKVLYRNQDFTAYTGLYLFRHWVARLLFIELTGTDCGDLTRTTIHGLKAASTVLVQALGAELGQLMGAPTTNRQEIQQAQERLHQEVARVGRVLADQYGFPYPAALEQIVLHNWQAFQQEIFTP
jgi:predicted nucleotidyltransferase